MVGHALRPLWGRAMSGLGEKERVYRELERTQHKCAALKREIKALRNAGSAKENVALRREATEYKKALSNIVHRLDTQGEIHPDVLRHIATVALALSGIKGSHRRDIEAMHRNG